MTDVHEHKWEYKETVKDVEKFSTVEYRYFLSAIFVCECGEVIKKEINNE